jgi:hypothetical protein
MWSDLKIKGYFWYGEKLYYGSKGEKAFLKLINKVNLKIFEFQNLLNQLDGSWSLSVISKKTKVYAVDRLGSRIKFYKKTSIDVACQDNLAALISFDMDYRSINYNLKSYYIKNKHCPIGQTLYKDIYTIPAGSYLLVEKNNANIIQYSSFRARKKFFTSDDVTTAKNNLLSVLKRMRETIKILNPKKIYIPLSGGMDSRLIAFGLSMDLKLKKKVLCYTYGKSSKNPEAIISKKVSNKLGLKWIFINYKTKTWTDLRKNLNQTLRNFDVGSSSFHFQEYIAAKRIVDKFGRGIFVPGYCLDVPAGHYLYSPSKYNKQFIKEHTLQKNYVLSDNSLNFENLFMLTRLSRKVIQEAKNFQYKKSDFILPFWFNEIYDYWYSRSYDARNKRLLFAKTISKIYKDSNTGLHLIPYANQSKIETGIVRIFLFKLREFVHNLYSIPLFKPILRSFFLKKRIIKSNKESDYLGAYNFSKNDNFITKLEFESYSTRIAEICYDYIVKKK